MIGIVLWYDAEKRVGMVWCEDQGPLAYFGPDVVIPAGMGDIERGAQIRFQMVESNGFRIVQTIDSLAIIPSMPDPVEILSEYSAKPQRGNLRVVA